MLAILGKSHSVSDWREFSISACSSEQMQAIGLFLSLGISKPFLMVSLSLAPSCGLSQTSSGALWIWTQILLRTSCTQKIQTSTAEPVTITKQRPARRLWTWKASPNWATASAPTSAPTTTLRQTDSTRNTTERRAGMKRRPLLARGGSSCMCVKQ